MLATFIGLKGGLNGGHVAGQYAESLAVGKSIRVERRNAGDPKRARAPVVSAGAGASARDRKAGDHAKVLFLRLKFE